MSHTDPTAEQRKQDHIQLAFESIVSQRDERFYYEPILAGHADMSQTLPSSIGGKSMDFPIWISSMTGGTERAKMINVNLAKACAKYKLGMGLGSCRQLLRDDSRLSDFSMRQHIGDQPLYANLGIAQIQELQQDNQLNLIPQMVTKLQADGLIIHINPLQEWMQPEGDRYYTAPIDTVKHCLDKLDMPIIVKEVGQGMGPRSLAALLALPVEAVDYGAHGGTNFSMLELARASEQHLDTFRPVTRIGHSAEDMNTYVNAFIDQGKTVNAKKIIISGGVKTFLDGYYHINTVKMPAIYAQASAMLKYALKGYEPICDYIESQIEGLLMATSLLTIKENC